MFTYTLWICSTLFNNKRRGRSLALSHTGCSWGAHQLKLRQMTFYSLTISTVTCHTHHPSDRCKHIHTHLTSGYCVCKMNVHVCRHVSVSNASTQRSLPTRPWRVLGTSSRVATPPERERAHNENRKLILRWQEKKLLGEMACVVLQPQWH